MTGRFLFAGVVTLGAWMSAGCARTYPYLFTDEGCYCEEYTRQDDEAQLTYHVVARYSVGSRIATDIQMAIANSGADTVDASTAFVKVTSHNIPYDYNDRYMSVGVRGILPGEHRTLSLRGRYAPAEGEDLWLRIPGEELSIALEGLTVGSRRIRRQEFRCIPHNPFLTQ